MMKIFRVHSQMLIMILLFASIVIGIYLRLIFIGEMGLRFDESQSLWLMSHSISYTINDLLRDVHLPLYFYLLHFWTTLFGYSEVVLRSFSLIWGILSIPVIGLLVYEITKDKLASIIAVVLTVLSPFLIWYSAETRMYTLVLFLSSLSYLLFIKFLNTKNRGIYIASLIVNVLGSLTHYFFVFVPLTQMLYLLILNRYIYKQNIQLEKFYDTKHLLAFYFAQLLMIGLSLGIWVISAFMVPESFESQPSLIPPTLFSTVLLFFELVIGQLPENIMAIFIAMWPLIILLLFLFLKKRETWINNHFILIAIGVVLPIASTFIASSLIRPMFLARYLILVFPPLIVFVSWFISQLNNSIRIIVSMALVAMFIYSSYTVFNSREYDGRENYEEALTYINKYARYNDLVFVAPAYTIYPAFYYYDGKARLHTLPIWQRRGESLPETTYESINEDIENTVTNHRYAYLLVTTNFTEADTVIDYMNRNFTLRNRSEFSNSVWVYTYDIRNNLQAGKNP